ncbi:MAG: VanZ family protein [Clostridia bacterium]|nr:VanZ family protein [Clostridia bacterium]
MKNNKKLLTLLAYFSAAVALASAAVVMASILIPSMKIRLRFFFACIFILIVSSIVTVIFTCNIIEDEKRKNIIVKTTMIASFAAYLTVFLGFLFLLKAFSNHASFTFAYNKRWLSDAIPQLIPFKSTAGKVAGMFSGSRNVFITLIELFGSLFAFVPFSFFLPAMFKNMRSFNSFLPVIVFLTVLTEAFQGMFRLGTCRIDDFILGVGGACIAFYIFRRPRVIRFFDSKHIYF